MMSEMKFTPGPWLAGREGYNEGVVYSMYDGICQVFGVPMNAWADDVGSEFSEGMANARLIASAPDLYEALKACLAYIEDDEGADSKHPAGDMARAALSKAEGGI